ncbi:hypothetical protein, partial [uncultured Bacteroides sp.]|uniref:hypothetical protein n=1 Tax=uncultured Bacteroides sp. TaxID=162156 RepID=UPI0026348841
PAKDDRYPKAINIINEEARISYVDFTLPKNDDLKFAYYMFSFLHLLTFYYLCKRPFTKALRWLAVG